MEQLQLRVMEDLKVEVEGGEVAIEEEEVVEEVTITEVVGVEVGEEDGEMVEVDGEVEEDGEAEEDGELVVDGEEEEDGVEATTNNHTATIIKVATTKVVMETSSNTEEISPEVAALLAVEVIEAIIEVVVRVIIIMGKGALGEIPKRDTMLGKQAEILSTIKQCLRTLGDFCCPNRPRTNHQIQPLLARMLRKM